MNPLSVTALTAYLFFAAATALIAGKDNRLRWVTKTLALPFLGLFYLSAADNPSWWILGALGFGLAGDVFLLAQKRKRFFLAGLAAFLMGHLFYVGYFFFTARWAAVPFPASAVYAAILLGVAFGIQRRLTNLSRVIRIPILLYMIVIGAMGLGTFLRWGSFSGVAFWAPFLGAQLFMVSDSLIAFRNFKRGHPSLHRWVSLTYYGAQLLLILGVS